VCEDARALRAMLKHEISMACECRVCAASDAGTGQAEGRGETAALCSRRDVTQLPTGGGEGKGGCSRYCAGRASSSCLPPPLPPFLAALGRSFFFLRFFLAPPSPLPPLSPSFRAPPKARPRRRSTTLFGITQLAEFAELSASLSLSLSSARSWDAATLCEAHFLYFSGVVRRAGRHA